MKDKTKEKVKKYATAAASTIAGEAVGLAMGELLSTDDMELENPSNSSAHNIEPQLASVTPVEGADTPIGQEEAENVKNEVEVIAVVSNSPSVEPVSSQETEVVAVESDDNLNFSGQPAIVSDDVHEVEVQSAVEELTLDDNQMNDEILNGQYAEDMISVVEEDDMEAQPSAIISEMNPIEDITEAIISADANGMPDYVNNANVDDFMA